jgi:hypothetical protein
MVSSCLVISSCEKEKAPEVDPNTLPSALFFVSEPQYVTLDDHNVTNTYAYVTVTNNSSNSNYFKWYRPGSIEKLDSKIDSLYRPITFETKSQDTIIKQLYLVTNIEQKFKITLTSYSYVPIGINPSDSTVIYEIFESNHPCIQEFKIKKRD